MKITRNTTMEQLKGFLSKNYTKVKKLDKALADSIMYASEQMKKAPKSVKKSDLIDLAKQVTKLLGDKVTDTTSTIQPVAENSVKPKLSAKKSAEKKSEVKEDETEEKPKQSKGKGKTEKKSPVKTLKGKASEKDERVVQLVEAFPTEIDVAEEHYEIAHDIKSMEDLHKALDNEETILFAYYWSKRHLKQFPYFSDWLGHPKSFDNDLDLASTLYVSDAKKVSYQMSIYTEAIYTILPTDFEEVDGVRIAGGIEFQIYRLVADK